MRALAFAAALCALLVSGCGGGSAEDASAPAPGVTETAAPEDAAMRPAAPPIEGATLDGERASLAALRGRQVFVNVWSSW
ncbi:MAG: TlpA family protein disulfide reductase [Gaiellaceae bacterium]|nr:hypothetical protein [Actinomycetota bacterium]